MLFSLSSFVAGSLLEMGDSNPGRAPRGGRSSSLWLSDEIASAVANSLRAEIEAIVGSLQGRGTLVVDVSGGENGTEKRAVAYVDIRKPEDVHGPSMADKDAFGRDLVRIWYSHDPSQVIPLVVVDTVEPITWLRVLPLPWLRSSDKENCCVCCGAKVCAMAS